MNMKKYKRVLLGMSGGTDSSVAAMLLQDAGYEVTGVTFRFYEPEGTVKYWEEAHKLAVQLGIEHFTIDARKIFRKTIINYFICEYMSAHTPVPCTFCNQLLKWPLLIELANKEGIFHVATGHYVQCKEIGNRYFLACGMDKEKDQSFFLWGLGQNILSRAILPLGALTKKEVRKRAQERGFLQLAGKKDSTGICFCPRGYQSFLKQEMGMDTFVPGVFIDEDGHELGIHQGYPFYTIGQRRGLGIHLNRAVFVKNIFPESNKIVLGNLNSLERKVMHLKNWNVMDKERLFEKENIMVKIRYRKQQNRCRVYLLKNGLLQVELFEPLTAVAPGQAAVFYENDLLLGGGIILAENEIS